MSTIAIEAPERSMPQRMQALQHANDVRSRRAQMKRDLKARGGRTRDGRWPARTPTSDVVGLIQNPPEWMDTMKVFNLLLATPKYGRVKANRILTQARISPSKTVGGLSDRQRRELVRLVIAGPR